MAKLIDNSLDKKPKELVSNRLMFPPNQPDGTFVFQIMGNRKTYELEIDNLQELGELIERARNRYTELSKPKRTTPVGYTVLSIDEDSIVVGVDFSQISKVSLEHIDYQGKRYFRGAIEPMPSQYSNAFCSYRRYHLQPQE